MYRVHFTDVAEEDVFSAVVPDLEDVFFAKIAGLNQEGHDAAIRLV